MRRVIWMAVVLAGALGLPRIARGDDDVDKDVAPRVQREAPPDRPAPPPRGVQEPLERVLPVDRAQTVERVSPGNRVQGPPRHFTAPITIPRQVQSPIGGRRPPEPPPPPNGNVVKTKPDVAAIGQPGPRPIVAPLPNEHRRVNKPKKPGLPDPPPPPPDQVANDKGEGTPASPPPASRLNPVSPNQPIPIPHRDNPMPRKPGTPPEPPPPPN